MPSYRFYFMHGGNSITRAVNHDCSSDDEAQRHAFDLLERWPVAAAIEAGSLMMLLSKSGSLGASLLAMSEAAANPTAVRRRGTFGNNGANFQGRQESRHGLHSAGGRRPRPASGG
jgi:hypothetical protein